MRGRALLAVALGLLVPGLGHAAVGRVRRGVALGGLILVSLAVGLALGGPLLPPDPARPLSFLATAASYATGAPAAVAALLGAGKGNLRAATYEYGLTFVLSAGLMNVLALFDAWDWASGRKR